MLNELVDYFLGIEYTMPGKPRGGKRKMWKRKPRARRGGRRTVNVNNALFPIPQRYITKMKYATTVLTDTSGNYIFAINNLADPDLTGGGHQPYGYDQLAALYSKYRVISASWRVQCPKTDQAIQMGCLPGNGLAVSSATPANFSLLKESPRAKYVVQMPGGSIATLSGKAYLPSINGRTKTQYMSDDRFQGFTANTTGPAEDIQLLVKVVSSTDVALVSVPIQVILEFAVEFFDVIQQKQSNI